MGTSEPSFLLNVWMHIVEGMTVGGYLAPRFVCAATRQLARYHMIRNRQHGHQACDSLSGLILVPAVDRALVLICLLFTPPKNAGKAVSPSSDTLQHRHIIAFSACPGDESLLILSGHKREMAERFQLIRTNYRSLYENMMQHNC